MSNIPYERCPKCAHHLDPQYGCGCKADPVAPVEAKEKDIRRLKEALQQSIEQREALCAQLEASEKLLENALKHSELLAEPKPTPSTPARIGSVAAYIGITEDQIKRFVGAMNMVGMEIVETSSRPQPDSSSSSDELTLTRLRAAQLQDRLDAVELKYAELVAGSSSISSEQTFEEWAKTKAALDLWEGLPRETWQLMMMAARHAWRAAKGAK